MNTPLATKSAPIAANGWLQCGPTRSRRKLCAEVFVRSSGAVGSGDQFYRTGSSPHAWASPTC
jgi:hypothetical protein